MLHLRLSGLFFQVWRVRVDVRVLDAAGNVTDAVFLCCLTALLAFKRPEVTVENSEDGSNPSIKVHPMEEREALPLSLHQSPIAVSFALFQVMYRHQILSSLPCKCQAEDALSDNMQDVFSSFRNP